MPDCVPLSLHDRRCRLNGRQLSANAPSTGMTEMSAAPDIGPNLRQLPAARHIGCPVVGTPDLFLGNMGEHQVDDLSIMLFALPFRPFVHNGRESGSETVRHVPHAIARAMEQIANRVIAN